MTVPGGARRPARVPQAGQPAHGQPAHGQEDED